MLIRILLILAIFGVILAVSPRPLTNIRDAGQKNHAVEGGARVYDDKELSVYLRGRVLTLKGPAAGGIAFLNLPADTLYALQGMEKTKPIVKRKGSNLEIAIGGSVYSVQLGSGPRIQAVYPDPACTGDKIIVDKHKNLLFLYKKGDLSRIYQVSTGKKPEYTPEGKFSVVNKFSIPDQPGEKLLGPRWLGIGVPDEYDLRSEKPDSRSPKGIKYGIHGTNEPESIGTYASGGCIRLSNEDIVEIYQLVEVGTPVEIINSLRNENSEYRSQNSEFG